MNGLKSLLLEVFAYHLLLVNPALEEGDAADTVKISAMITVCLPLLVILASFVAIFASVTNREIVNAIIVIAVLLIYFGVSSVTDKVYDRNARAIRRRADEIHTNSEQGVSWVRIRLLSIYATSVAIVAVVVFLAKLIT